MFKCKVCQAKNELVAQLRSEVAYLRQLAIPQNSPYELPTYVVEANRIMDGSAEAVERDTTETPQDKADRQAREELEQVVLGEY